MPRTSRACVGDICYHVINRGNGRREIFHNCDDYQAFVELLREAGARVGMRLLAYCLMPNHFHLLLWPHGDDDLSRYMHWLLTTHVCRYNKHYGTSGRIWQGRFKAFPIQQDGHLLVAARYIERNPVRAGLVRRASEWEWSSSGVRLGVRNHIELDGGPVVWPASWADWVNTPFAPGELDRVRTCVNKGTPFGRRDWVLVTAAHLGLESSLRPRGRPRLLP
ncbi:MAG: transposase [Nitrospirae bacterium]|nr:transposase [Nitrospirota bacterium]